MPQQTYTITKNEKNNNNFTYPQYQNNNISNIPDLLKEIFELNNKTQNTQNKYITEKTATKQNKKVVLIIMDGFGYNQFLKHHKKNPFLTKLTNRGIVQSLASVFPSQTTNALTTLNTGLTPQEHGIFEYFIYLKNIGIINALKFERINTNTKNNLIKEGYNPNSLLLKGKTIYNTLNENGIKTFTHTNITNAFNACSKIIFQGSTITPSLKIADTIVSLRKNLEENKNNSAYFFVHLDTLDTIAHEYGPNSYQYCAELSVITYLLNKELVQKLDPKTAKDTLLLLTADHGSVNVDINRTIYLPKTSPLHMQIGEDQKPIPPTGSPREIFLHIKNEKLDEAKQWLIRKIGDKAQIIETKEAAEMGLFGVGKASDEFLERTGNLLILPYNNETIWFENSNEKITYLGQHGGLNKHEMLVPFSVANLRNLKEKTV
ncbi:MAG: alkaline phosphatase family protein [Nitrososphaerota archaeon]|nr:alkaline phosphatase family protein [Nitrososphaerota archaeon]